ncbi:4147_t:CDS:2 [Gigaspora margarita]|uniref:4147_t:CDS:1 n=1 Tax=Gigaspora margarita TaxID=4874 RepID=A0ABN7UN35_GIGMA|nr:4147_t:CDS:2 [Gigaspora margarita]
MRMPTNYDNTKTREKILGKKGESKARKKSYDDANDEITITSVMTTRRE